MAESFLIYTPNPPSISTLTSSGKQSEWTKIKKNMENLLMNYKTNDYENQETELFDFIDKPFKEMSCSHFLKIIKKLIEKIKDDDKEYNLKSEPVTFNSNDINVFHLTFRNIFALAHIIIHLIENTTSKKKLSDVVYEFAYKNTIPSYKNVVINKQDLTELINYLNYVKTLKIRIFNENEDTYLNNENKKNSKSNNIRFKMDSKIVLLFSLFFKTLFSSVSLAIIDLNIPPIDNYFIQNNNPYLINEEEILNLGNYYKDIIICNLVLIKALRDFSYLGSLNLEMYDSYQIELHSVLTKALDNSENSEVDSTKKKLNKSIKVDDSLNIYSPKFNNNYLYIQHLLASPEMKYYDFSLDFNSLDPLIFDSVNLLLAKFKGITTLNLGFFPKKKINKRKIHFNGCYYNKYANNDDESLHLYSNEDKKIYYEYLDKNDNSNNNCNNFILKDEKLLNELFFSFNMNLRSLSIILEKNIKELLTLKIDFSTYNNESISLCNYDNYNCSIICFIFDLFKSLQTQVDACKITKLEIFYDDFLDEKAYVLETIKIKIPSCRNGFKLNNLRIIHINFNISNISLILPFENFPSINLTELILSNLSFNDLYNLVHALKKNKKENLFPVLVKLDLSLGIMVEDYTAPLEILLRECIPPKLIYFNLNLPVNISMPQLIDILYWIKCGHSEDIHINIKIFHSTLSLFTDANLLKEEVSKLIKESKDLFKKEIYYFNVILLTIIILNLL